MQPFIQVQIEENIKAFVRGIQQWPMNSPHKESVKDISI